VPVRRPASLLYNPPAPCSTGGRGSTLAIRA
jgi:hypothetical protein